MKYFSTLILCFFTLEIKAQTVTWEEALHYTIEGSPELAAAKNEYMAKKEEESAAFGSFLPKLNATTSLIESKDTTYAASLNLNHNLFNGLSDSARYSEAKLRSETSRWNLISTKANLSFQLKEVFATLVYAQDTLTLSQSILERRESNYKLVSVRYDNGRENKGSVLLAEAYFEQAKLDLLKAQDGLKTAQDALKSIMNKEHLGQVKVAGEVPLVQIQAKNKTLSEMALETPAYNLAELQQKISEESMKIARSSFFPSLDLNGNIGRTGESYFPDREKWSVGLTLTIPLFDGFKDKNKLEASTFQKYAAENKKRHTFLELIPKLGEAKNFADQSNTKFNVDTKFKDAAQTRAEIARARYNNGLISFEDWDIIENELIARQTNFLLSRKDRVVKYAGWEKILGRGVIP